MPFASFDRNGLDVVIEFQTGRSVDPKDLKAAVELFGAAATASMDAEGWSKKERSRFLQDKLDDLRDPPARLLLLRADSALAGFAHFRFTVQGETVSEMEGEPVVLLSDLVLAPAQQRKGLGTHCLRLLELIAGAGSALSLGEMAAYVGAVEDVLNRRFLLVTDLLRTCEGYRAKFGREVGLLDPAPPAAAAAAAEQVLPQSRFRDEDVLDDDEDELADDDDDDDAVRAAVGGAPVFRR